MAGYWNRIWCRYCLICLEGKPSSRKIGFFIQMDRVIKFLVGANHARKWERHFALSAKKKGFLCNNQGLLQLLQHARGQSHKTMVNEILGGSHMVLHPLSQQMQAKPVITTKYSICFNCYCCFKTARDTLGRSNAVGHCSVILSRMKQQGLNWYGLWTGFDISTSPVARG